RAGDQLEVVVGGIKPFNYEYVLEELNCRQVHISSFNTRKDKSTAAVSDVYFGSTIHPPEDQYQVVNREGISELGSKIKKISGCKGW
ncbi:MAG: hypothetical protein ACOC2G_02015, partial [Bacillota bacterium]